MDRMAKMMKLEIFRDSENDETIDDLQFMTLMGMFDDDQDDLF